MADKITGTIKGVVMEVGPAGREGHTVKLYQKGTDLIDVWKVPGAIANSLNDGQTIEVEGEFRAYIPERTPGVVRIGFAFGGLKNEKQFVKTA